MMPALSLPFAHLNLRRNPFGEPTREERAALAITSVAALRNGEIVQFVGPSGRGKTTHLLALSHFHAGAVYERLDEGDVRPRRAPLGGGAVYLLDEAQRAGSGELERIGACVRTIALGTHDDLGSRFGGRPVRTVEVGGIDLETLARVVEARLRWARRGDSAPIPRVPAATLARLLARHGDDVRAIESDLYDAFQALEEPCDVEL